MLLKQNLSFGKKAIGILAIVVAALALSSSARVTPADGPYQATGMKICEVETESAIIWARLTRHAQREGSDRPMPKYRYRDPATGQLKEFQRGEAKDWDPVVEFPGGATIETIEGAVPGAPGEVRVRYRSKDRAEWQATGWQPVDPQRDFTRQFLLRGLQPSTVYELRVDSRSSDAAQPGQTLDGRFRTAPVSDRPARVLFTVSTGQAYPDRDTTDGFKIYPSMLKLDPDFFVHTGDILYYDQWAKSLALARWVWSRMYSLPTNVDFHRQVASYFIKDDHDTWMNDCWPTMKVRFMGEFTFRQGQAVFLEQVGMGERTYRTVRWGKDLQIWMVEGRDFRSPNPMPDGPLKTIWGKEQKEWFKRSVHESDATFRLLISPTPLVGPDRTNKNDNHANVGFTYEGNELRRFIADQKNMYVVCGDRHWQYVSVDAGTGVREYSCGPASDRHAGGWPKDRRLPEHRYLNVIGGFLAGVVERQEGKPVLTFRHYSVDGKLLNEDHLP